MSNLLQRILTGVVGILLVGFLTSMGGWYFVALVLGVVWAGQYEFYLLSPQKMRRRHIGFGLLVGGLIVLQQYGYDFMVDLMVLGIIVLIVYDLFDLKLELGWVQSAWMAAGIVYPALLFSYGIRLREGWGDRLSSEEAFYLTMSLLALVWITDSLAYFVGRSLGKHPLAPAISPKKTWEGTLGGFTGALFAAVILKLFLLEFWNWVDAIALGMIGGVGGQIGDLVESRLKRAVGVKDSGALLPGHGGILDRVDGLIVAIPLYYLYLTYFASF
jgi:phosphatidate cytidylyltransferase